MVRQGTAWAVHIPRRQCVDEDIKRGRRIQEAALLIGCILAEEQVERQLACQKEVHFLLLIFLYNIQNVLSAEVGAGIPRSGIDFVKKNLWVLFCMVAGTEDFGILSADERDP